MSKIGISPFRYVSIDELMLFFCCSRKTAINRKKELCSKYMKNNVSYYDLAKSEGYAVKDILSFLYP